MIIANHVNLGNYSHCAVYSSRMTAIFMLEVMVVRIMFRTGES